MTLSITVQLFSWHTDYTNIRGSPRTSRLHTAQTLDSVHHINNMVLEDRHVTEKEMSIQMGIGGESVCRILKRLGLKRFVQTGF
jgi:hypothetical protein